MWFGGVRVIISDDEGRLLLVCQHHEDRDIWMLPGGTVEAGENSMEAAKREALEETGLQISVTDLIWHVEEVSKQRGQRFVNFFMARIEGGECMLGRDPELGPEGQVLKEIRFMYRDEVNNLPYVYPAFLKEDVWDILNKYKNPVSMPAPVYRIREGYNIIRENEKQEP